MPAAHRERGHLIAHRDSSADGIRVRELCAGYGDRQVLGPLSFDLRLGETSAFLGPGGAGKSTLFRILHEHILHEAVEPELWRCGEVEVPFLEGRHFRQKSRAITGTLGGRLRDVADDAEALLSSVWTPSPEAASRLRDLLEVPAADLGFPEARLAELTVTLAGGPSIVLLDEPEADLEEPFLSWVRELLGYWRSRTTLILATHHLEIVREVSDRTFLLIEGRLIESGVTEEIFTRPKLPRTESFLRWGS